MARAGAWIIRVRNRPFHIAFRILTVSSGLLLVCLASLQLFPKLREQLVIVRTGYGREEASRDATSLANLDERDDAALSISGSAVIGEASSVTRAQPSTLEFDPADRRATVASAADIPPPPVPSALSDEIERLHERVRALEEEPAANWPRLVEILERLESRAAHVQSTLGQLELAERLLKEREKNPPVDDKALSAPQRIAIRSTTDEGRRGWTIEARDASLPELLVRLGDMTGLNLLVSPEVAGTVSLHVHVADAKEALEAVCRIHQCRLESAGLFTVVSRQAPPPRTETSAPATGQTVTKLYRLKYLTGAEIRPYVAAILTPGFGTVSFASVRERVAPKGYRDPPRAILVKDLPNVIADVDRLILELDQPLGKGSLPRPKPPAPIASPTAAQTPLQPILPAPPALLPPPQDAEVFELPVEVGAPR
jgi:hypothetical protein